LYINSMVKSPLKLRRLVPATIRTRDPPAPAAGCRGRATGRARCLPNATASAVHISDPSTMLLINFDLVARPSPEEEDLLAQHLQ
jgi:hypothetical protein